jgi:hypothetical protein
MVFCIQVTEDAVSLRGVVKLIQGSTHRDELHSPLVRQLHIVFIVFIRERTPSVLIFIRGRMQFAPTGTSFI